VVTRLIASKVDPSEAAPLLGLSVRSIRRLRARYLDAGPAALAHGNRGRRPIHALDPATSERVVHLAKTTYAGCNDSHLTELLAEREGIALARASVRRILRVAGLKSPRRHRPTRYHGRRERGVAAGMLLQLDGSKARWFGDAQPFCTLVAAIDDATGDVCAAVFREQEDAAGYFMVLARCLLSEACPWRCTATATESFRSTAACAQAARKSLRACASRRSSDVRSQSSAWRRSSPTRRRPPDRMIPEKDANFQFFMATFSGPP
jgi:transposase